MSDAEGRFIFNVTEGRKYSVEVSFSGYEKKTVNDIDPSVDEGLTISLSPITKSMQEIVVTSSSRKETIASLYTQQRTSSSIQDGISSEAIRRTPDRNTGEVIRRVSGTSIQDNKFVIVRGLNERYNVAMLNSSVLPSTEPDKKAFSFDIIPSSAIENVIVYKSATPDLPGDFSGGLVKVLTKDYPAKSFTEVSISFSGNTLTTGQDFYGTTNRPSSERFGFFDGSRNVPAGYVANRGSSFITLPNANKQSITKQFPNSYAYDGLLQSPPNMSVGISGGRSYAFSKGGKLGLTYMVGYGLGRKVFERQRSDYMLGYNLLYENQTTTYESKNSLSSMLNVAYAKGKSKYSLKALFNNDFSNQIGLRSGYNIVNMPTRFELKSYNNELSAVGLWSFVFDAKHALNKNFSIDWNASVSNAYKNQPDQKVVSLRTPDDKKTDYFIKLGNENSPEVRNAGRIFSDLNEMIYNGGVNLVYNLSSKFGYRRLKAGALSYYRDRSALVDALGYASLNFRGVSIYETKSTTFGNIFSASNVDAFGLTLATIGNNSTSYDASALLNAGYLMFDGNLSEGLKVTAGARVESYDQHLLALNQPDIQLKNTDVLPSMLITYAAGKKANLRFAASESVNRPEFRELASYSVFDYDNFVVVRGNPDLKRSVVRNIDLRYEIFPASGEIFSISAFYKYFTNPIEQVNSGNDILSYKNAEKANTYGAELEIRKKLDFIPGKVFENLHFYTNMAYMLGSVVFKGTQVNTPLQGQSPYILNGSLTYATGNNLSLSLHYNRIGPRLKFRAVQGGAFNIFENSRDIIDFQMNAKILKGKVDLKAAIVDLLAQPFKWYYKFEPDPKNTYFDPAKDRVINSARFGTGFNLGFKVNL